MSGPYVYPAPKLLIGEPHVADKAGRNLGQCVSLLKHYIEDLQDRLSSSWKEGDNVIETLKKGDEILEGTAIATFRNGEFVSGNGHAALFSCYKEEKGEIFIVVVDQYSSSGGIVERRLKNFGQNADGTWENQSNNGRAFSVIL